jgi:hypothetical protein
VGDRFNNVFLCAINALTVERKLQLRALRPGFFLPILGRNSPRGIQIRVLFSLELFGSVVAAALDAKHRFRMPITSLPSCAQLG